MIGMIVGCGMCKNQHRFELAKDFHQRQTRRDRVGECPVGNPSKKNLCAKELSGIDHFLSSFGGKVFDGYRRLAFVALAQDANRDFSSIGLRARERAGTKQFCIVGMSNDGENPIARKRNGHNDNGCWNRVFDKANRSAGTGGEFTYLTLGADVSYWPP